MELLLLSVSVFFLFLVYKGNTEFRVVGTIGLLCILWGSFIEPLLLVIRKNVFQEDSLQGLRIAVISDLHIGIFCSKKNLARIVRKLNTLDVDAVLIPGDFLYGKAIDFAGELEPLSHIKAPVFVTLGNHDHIFKGKDSGISFLRKKLVSFDVRELKNEAIKFKENIWFVGVDDNDSGFDDLLIAFQNVPENAATILLAHSPDILQEKLSARANFIITGHTHGGQIRMPWGSIPFVIPINDSTYDRGLFSEKKLLVTSGIGMVGIHARFLNPPEIRIISFISSDSN